MEQGMDVEFTKWLVTLGVGGVLAGFMFVFYRKDVKQYTELWRVTAEQLMNVVKENTASNSKLIALIENQERNMMRKQDIELLLDSQRKVLEGQRVAHTDSLEERRTR
jgi:glucose-6-phosphate-specific signal transduction histidine kinase